MKQLAVDAGQSGVRARLVDSRAELSGTPKPATQELDLTRHPGIRTDRPLAQQLAELITSIARESGPIDAIAVGSTGFTGKEQIKELDPLVRLGVREVLLAHDSTTSYLGALGTTQGAVVAAGTGVVTLAVGANAVARVDGWGNIMGDAGSAYWFGRSALDAAMRAYDGRGPATVLLDRVREEFNDVEGAYIELQADESRVRRTASFARWVTEASAEGDVVATNVCRRGAHELAHSAISALDRVGIAPQEPAAVCAIGGIFHSLVITRAFEAEMHARRPTIQRVVPRGDGLHGATELFGLESSNPLTGRITRVIF